jgi:hypothetical protein
MISETLQSKIKSEKRKNRDLTHKELCTWLTSIDLGHGRNDVVRYYCDYPKRK